MIQHLSWEAKTFLSFRQSQLIFRSEFWGESFQNFATICFCQQEKSFWEKFMLVIIFLKKKPDATKFQSEMQPASTIVQNVYNS